MTVGYMRKKIKEAYTSKFWLNKVDEMPDDQIIAVYYSFLERRKFDKPKKKKEEFHQITLEEWLNG